MQDIRNVNSELLEPHIYLAARRAIGKDQSIILIHCQQALATTSRPKDGHCIRAVWLAKSRSTHPSFCDNGGLSRKSYKFVRNNGRYTTRVYAFG